MTEAAIRVIEITTTKMAARRTNTLEFAARRIWLQFNFEGLRILPSNLEVINTGRGAEWLWAMITNHAKSFG